MAANKKKAITPEQEAQIPVWRDKWHKTLLSTAPSARKTAEANVEAAYALFNLPQPRAVKWWLGSPASLLEKLKAAGTSSGFGQLTVWAAVVDHVDLPPFYRQRRLLQVRRPWQFAFGGSVQLGQVAEISESLPWFDYCRSVLGLRRETQRMAPAIRLAKSVGGVVMTTKTCYLIERWSQLTLNAQGVPHSVTGPAIRYRNGQEVFAYHGSTAPAYGEIFRHAQGMTINEIIHERHPMFRDFMIEVYKGGREKGGLEALIRDMASLSSGSSIVDDDPRYGTLHRVHVGNTPVAAVRVVNSTPEPDGSHRIYWLRVPPTFNRARTAIGWTFRMPGKFYAPVKES